MYKKLLTVTLIGLVSLLFTGCGASLKTVVSPSTKSPTIVNIVVDQDSTALGAIMIGSVVRTNYMYSFAAAATEAKRQGYKYFSIINSARMKKQFFERGVKNVKDAYDACDKGDGSFNMAYDFANFRADTVNNCETIVYRWTETTIKGTTAHGRITYYIELHNEKRQDNVTFNAKEVLESNLLKDLNPEYFITMSR